MMNMNIFQTSDGNDLKGLEIHFKVVSILYHTIKKNKKNVFFKCFSRFYFFMRVLALETHLESDIF